MGRPQKPDAPWRAGATPEDLAELADIEAQAEALRQQIGELAYRRIKITAKCRSRVISKHRKESEIELGKLRKQLADGRKLAF